ncbi:hypothetical protein WJX72_012163 [[Myrmecia] bisecta]|uniref:RNA polymerase-associated protein CTR9 n=1 Tax=[Myrmecia] bisecta TaxID=41462 RepID=A0AAW1PL31_9CHLO
MDVDNHNYIHIPITDSEEVVSVPLDQLPDDPDELLGILKAEIAPLSLWLDIAKVYLSQGRIDQYLTVLNEGTSPEVEEYFGDKVKFERIQFLCALAAYYTALGKAEKDRVARNEAFTKANGFWSKARHVDYNEQLPYIAAGQLALAKGDIPGAKREFTRAISMKHNGQTNISGLLAMANIHFNEGNNVEALAMYRKALVEHPGCPPEVRLGLAAANYRLGRFDKAKAAYERVLQLDPVSADALLGLAVLSFNGKDADRGYREGLQYLCRAYSSDPGNPAVLNLLAHCCLMRKEYSKARRLAATALESAGVERMRAQCLTYMARASHALGDMREAFRCYQQASQLDPKLPLPMLGLAQLNLLQGEHVNAVSLLEKSLAEVPSWDDALTVLGHVYPQMPAKGAKAVDHFRTAAAKPGASCQVWEMLGELLAGTDPAAALAAYKKSLELARREAAKKPEANGHAEANGLAEAAGQLTPKLLNNAAVLHMRAGELQQALALMTEALQAASGGMGAGFSAGAQVTMGYNLARLREACHDTKAAESDYKGILEQFPGYVDCYLRLACMERQRGRFAHAIEWVEKALKVDEHNSDARVLLAALHIDKKDYPEGDKLLKAILAHPDTKHDAYAKLCMGNLFLDTAPSDRKKGDSQARAERNLKMAAEQYKQVLQTAPGNLYAANGIGAVLAEQGSFGNAREIFQRVQETAAASEGFLQMPDTAVNLASLHLAQEQYQAAVQLYNSTLKKHFHNNNARILLYLARAHYDADNLMEAKSALLRAMHLDPSDHKLGFNTALTMQEFAVRTLRKKRPEGDPNKLAEFDLAVGQLTDAGRFFGVFRGLGSAKSGIDSKRLDAHIAFCTDTLNRAQAHLEQARKEQALVEAKRAQSLAALEAAARQREAVAAEKAAAERRAGEERERRAKQQAEKLARLKEEWRDKAVMAAAAEEGDAAKLDKKKRKKTLDDAVNDLFEEEEDDGDYDPNQAAGGEPGGEPDFDEARLKGTGLLSSDEEDDEGLEVANDEEQEAAPSKAAPGSQPEAASSAPRSRLKRHREQDDGAEPDMGLADAGLEDDSGPVKRGRKAVLEDSDEEDEQPAGRPAALDQDQDPDVDVEGDAGEEEADKPSNAKVVEDLFGSDDDE